MIKELERVKRIARRISLNAMGVNFGIVVAHDQIHMSHVSDIVEPRVYIQMKYRCPDTKEEGEDAEWKGGKWYLSPYMTDDEIVKKIYLAFRTAVEHEVLEGFKVDDVAIFNPHRNFEDLVNLGDRPEVRRS